MEEFVVFALTLIAAFLVAIVAVLGQKLSVEKIDRPRVSDAEFLALCRPGTNPHVALKVRRMVADSFGVRYDRIRPTDHFEEDYGVC